jgi:hypothetical protein
MLLRKTKRNENSYEEEINQNIISLDYTYKKIEEEVKSELKKIEDYSKKKGQYLNCKDYKLFIFLN